MSTEPDLPLITSSAVMPAMSADPDRAGCKLIQSVRVVNTSCGGRVVTSVVCNVSHLFTVNYNDEWIARRAQRPYTAIPTHAENHVGFDYHDGQTIRLTSLSSVCRVGHSSDLRGPVDHTRAMLP